MLPDRSRVPLPSMSAPPTARQGVAGLMRSSPGFRTPSRSRVHTSPLLAFKLPGVSEGRAGEHPRIQAGIPTKRDVTWAPVKSVPVEQSEDVSLVVYRGDVYGESLTRCVRNGDAQPGQDHVELPVGVVEGAAAGLYLKRRVVANDGGRPRRRPQRHHRQCREIGPRACRPGHREGPDHLATAVDAVRPDMVRHHPVSTPFAYLLESSISTAPRDDRMNPRLRRFSSDTNR